MKPTFDFPLFAARVCVGGLTGLAAALTAPTIDWRTVVAPMVAAALIDLQLFIKARGGETP
jgi:hypothetical protein